MSELLRRLQWLFRRRRFERELDEELQHHLAMKADAGYDRRFGNVVLIKEESRAMWTFTFWEQLGQDVRYGLRTMWKSKTFTAMAVLSLALGIGANTAIYSFLHAILLRSLPVSHPEELVILSWRSPVARTAVVHGLNGTMHRSGTLGSESPNFPFAAFEALRGRSDIVSTLFGYAFAYEINLVARNQAEVSRGMYVSGGFYSGLGMIPAAGRLITDEDDRSGAARVAVITFDYWQRRFAGDPAVVGQQLTINRIPFTIIGVSGRGFYGVDSSYEAPVFLPLHAQPLLARKPAEEEHRRFFDKNFYWVEMMGRLRPGVTQVQAQAVFGGMFHQFANSTATTAKEKSQLPELWLDAGAGGMDSLRRQYSKPLYVLMSMVGLILIIACANIANLLLARASARRREVAVRLSLGAGRLRVIRQLLTESVLLSVSGGILGIVIALWGVRLIGWLLLDGRDEMVLRATLDWPVLAFTAALALVTGFVFGLAPAIQATGGAVAPTLKESVIGRVRRSRASLGQVLVVVQIAISLLLVLAASLSVRTLTNLHSVEVGFNQENLLIFNVNARQAGYTEETVGHFYADLSNRFRHMPWVRSAAFSNFPLVGHYWDDTNLTIPGAPIEAGKKLSTSILQVDESFLGTMQIPVLLGRGIEDRDIASPRVVVVTELFAKKFFGGQNPVGRHIGIGDRAADLEIVGVTKTTLYNSVREETPPLIYVPYTLYPQGGVWFELRAVGNPLALGVAVRQIVHDAAPAVPVARMKTQAAQIDQTIAQERMFADLCACFAFLALVIACVGLYGMTAYAVARRTSEIGIRVALGAERQRIVWMMLRQVMVLTVVGLGIGLFTAWETSHFVASFLFGLKPNDPMALWGSAVVLMVAAMVAAYRPALRAARVDPMVALRNE